MLEPAVLDRYLEDIAARLESRILPKIVGHLATEQRLLDTTAAAKYVGRSENAVKILVHRGKLPVTKIDNKVQFDRRALDKLIDDCTYFEV
jgi:hypothetical protein